MDASIPKFDCYSDPATLGPRWTRLLNAFELFADGKGLILTDNASVATKQRRRALLLHHAGTDVQDIFSTLADTGGPTDYEQAVTALNSYFVPQVNTAFARQTFYQLKQKTGQTVQQFVTCLRQAAKDCDFGADKDNQIRDAVLSRCNFEYVRRKLLEEGTDLTLTRTLEIAVQCECVELQMVALHISQDSEIKETVSLVSKKGKKTEKNACNTVKEEQIRLRLVTDADRQVFLRRIINALHVENHAGDAMGKIISQKMCKTKDSSKQTIKRVDSEEKNQEFAFVVKEESNMDRITFSVGGIKLPMLVDSGATSFIVDERTWEMLQEKKIKCGSARSDKKLYAYSSSEPLLVKGIFWCEVGIGKRSTTAEFTVICGRGEPLLGKDTAVKLGVLRIGANVAAVSDLKSMI